MRNLISLGGPQQGVHSFPRCEKRFGSFCKIIQWIINSNVYTVVGQRVVQGTYWHDTDEARYRRGSTFLAVINNENQKNFDYVKNLNELKRLVLVKYVRDGAVEPSESSWFGFYDASGNEHPMEQTEVYLKDKLGLQAMLAGGKLLRLLSPNDHLDLDPAWFEQNIIPLLRET